MFVSAAVAEELKRIIRDSEVTKSVPDPFVSGFHALKALNPLCGHLLTIHREDDVSWPKKNIVGRQELEVRIDKEHISFEVSHFAPNRLMVRY